MKTVPDIIIYSDNSINILGEDGFGKEDKILQYYCVPKNRRRDMKFKAKDGCVILALRKIHKHMFAQERKN